MISKQQYLKVLEELKSKFNKKYSDVTIDFNTITEKSTDEILEGEEGDDYNKFKDWSFNMKYYYIDRKGSPFADIISHMSFSKDNNNHILLKIGYSAQKIIEHENLINSYDYYKNYNDTEELYNELEYEYFNIDLSNPLGV